jgi:1-acyl-sn-glycerol-3-phosphate acyltransferase
MTVWRRWVSLLYTIPVCMGATGFLIGISLCLLPFDPQGNISAWMFRFWARTILAICRVKVRFHGAEKIAAGAHYVCVANHTSLIDIPILVAAMPLQLCFVAKEELFAIPVFGAYLRRMRHIPVARANTRAAVKSMADAARAIAAGTRSVMIFPEGTRSPDGQLQEFKDGAALLAIRSGVPLLPLAIHGTGRIWPARSKVITPGVADIYAGDAVVTEGLGTAARAELTAALRAGTEALLSRAEPGPLRQREQVKTA